MSEIIMRDLCPHCERKTIVWFEDENGSIEFRVCQHCGESPEDWPWRSKAWFIARELEPEKGGESFLSRLGKKTIRCIIRRLKKGE